MRFEISPNTSPSPYIEKYKIRPDKVWGWIKQFRPPRNQYRRNYDIEEYCILNNIPMETTTDLTPLDGNIGAAYQDIAKMEKLEPEYNTISWEASYWMLIDDYKNIFCDTGPTSLSEVIENTDLTKAAGFPESLIGNKYDCIMSPIFEEFFIKYMNIVDTHDTFEVFHFLSVFLKEELRPLEKIEINKIRDVCPSDLAHLLLTQMCCMQYSHKMVASSSDPDEMSTVGINPFYLGWDTLYRSISRLPHGGMADVSQWDSSMFVQMILDDMELCWYYFKCPKYERQIWRKRFYWTYMGIIYALVLMPTGEVLYKFRSQTSGNGLTTYLNTRGHKRIWFYIWNRVTGKNSVLEMKEFLIVKLYGDDVIYTVDNNFVDALHPKVVAKFYAELGFKLEGNTEFVDPLYLLFLNRSFEKVGAYVSFKMKDPNKALSALLNLKKHSHPCYTIQQIQGLKVAYFLWSDTYKMLCDIERYIIAKYCNIYSHDIEWKNTIKGILSKSQIVTLYFAKSTGGPAMPVENT